MFTKNATNHWNEESQFLASDAAANDTFGFRVATSGDVAIAGAPGKQSNTGAAYIFGVTVSTSNDDLSEKSRRGSGCSDCLPPTLGFNKEGNKRLVDYGFSYNGNPAQVAHYYTPYPLIGTNVGDLNTLDLKIFEDSGYDKISHVAVAFGLDASHTFNDSIAVVEWDRLFDVNQTITVTDPHGILQDVRVDAKKDPVKCMNSDNVPRCLAITFYHTFREAPEFNKVGTNIWDDKRNAWQNYFNHGIHVHGESLNPPDVFTGIDKGHIYHITETGKNKAVDEFGNTWTLKHGIYEKDYFVPEKQEQDLMNPDKLWAIQHLKGKTPEEITLMLGYDINHKKFGAYKQEQFTLSESIVNKLCPKCDDMPYDKINNIVTSNNSYKIPRSENQLLQDELKRQNNIAQEIFAKITMR